MRLVVTGAAGQLGRAVTQGWAEDQAVALERAVCDVNHEPTVWAAVRDYAPDVVVNCAAYTAVDACEDDPEPAWAVNAHGVGKLSRTCAAAGALLAHVSCAEVFDGRAERAYAEFGRPRPRSLLGRTKDAGEELVRKQSSEPIVARTSWLQGAARPCAVTRMPNEAREHGRARVPAASATAPTFAADLAERLRPLAAKRRAGSYHLTSEGEATPAELAYTEVQAAGLDAEVEVVESAGDSGVAPPFPARLM